MASTTKTELQAFSSIGVDIGKDVFHLVVLVSETREIFEKFSL